MTLVACAKMFGQICPGSATAPPPPSQTWAEAGVPLHLGAVVWVMIRRTWESHLYRASDSKMPFPSLQFHEEQRAPWDA